MDHDAVGWRAYYTRSRVFDSRDMDWSDLPRTGVLGVVVFYDAFAAEDSVRYRRLVDGGDWYYLEDGEPECTDTHHDWERWIDPPDVPLEQLKRGEATDDRTFERVQQRMMEDRTWP